MSWCKIFLSSFFLLFLSFSSTKAQASHNSYPKDMDDLNAPESDEIEIIETENGPVAVLMDLEKRHMPFSPYREEGALISRTPNNTEARYYKELQNKPQGWIHVQVHKDPQVIDKRLSQFYSVSWKRNGEVLAWDASHTSTGRVSNDPKWKGSETPVGDYKIAAHGKGALYGETGPKALRGSVTLDWGIRIEQNILLHLGPVKNKRASKGCIRMPGNALSNVDRNKNGESDTDFAGKSSHPHYSSHGDYNKAYFLNSVVRKFGQENVLVTVYGRAQDTLPPLERSVEDILHRLRYPGKKGTMGFLGEDTHSSTPTAQLLDSHTYYRDSTPDLSNKKSSSTRSSSSNRSSTRSSSSASSSSSRSSSSTRSSKPAPVRAKPIAPKSVQPEKRGLGRLGQKIKEGLQNRNSSQRR